MDDSLQTFADIFSAPVDEERRQAVLAMPQPKMPYLIAFTPRSGSSYLCDVLRQCRLMGRPDEYLSTIFLPRLRQRLAPAYCADEYLDLLLRATRSGSGISGLKATWCQFRDFSQLLRKPKELPAFRFIYLTRRNLAAQAVSLYRATQSGIFHTNVPIHEQDARTLEELPYDFEKIDYWHRHILAQEQGWRSYFNAQRIFPLSITYEDIEEDVIATAQRMAYFLERPKAAQRAVPGSVFQKLAQRQNVEWSCRYTLERDAQSRVMALL
jgi:LPS sulfotransferase NodH